MILRVLLVILLGNTAVFAQGAVPENEFVKSYPDQMVCEGEEVSHVGNIKSVLMEPVTVIFSDKETETPMVEVINPSSQWDQ